MLSDSDSSGGADYGAQYRGINQTVYYMRKMGKSNAEIIAYLDRQSESDLSDNGYKNLIQNYGL